MYDLTSFLSTIVSASSSIVAILGGFIASKLISIDGERDSVLSRLKAIDKELSYYVSECDKLQKEDETEALNFISEHVDDFFSRKKLEPIYQCEQKVNLSIEKLNDFWKRGLDLLVEYIKELKNEKAKINDDYIPDTLVQKYRNCYFENELINLFGEKVKRDYGSTSKSTGSFLGFPPIESISITRPIFVSNERAIIEKEHEIDLLRMKKQLLEDQIPMLKKPKGIKIGLSIFALFSIACIIFPLVLSPFTTDNLQYYNLTKWGVLGMFFTGLSGMFIYLIYLLHWK